MMEINNKLLCEAIYNHLRYAHNFSYAERTKIDHEWYFHVLDGVLETNHFPKTVDLDSTLSHVAVQAGYKDGSLLIAASGVYFPMEKALFQDRDGKLVGYADMLPWILNTPPLQLTPVPSVRYLEMVMSLLEHKFHFKTRGDASHMTYFGDILCDGKTYSVTVTHNTHAKYTHLYIQKHGDDGLSEWGFWRGPKGLMAAQDQSESMSRQHGGDRTGLEVLTDLIESGEAVTKKIQDLTNQELLLTMQAAILHKVTKISGDWNDYSSVYKLIEQRVQR